MIYTHFLVSLIKNCGFLYRLLTFAKLGLKEDQQPISRQTFILASKQESTIAIGKTFFTMNNEVC